MYFRRNCRATVGTHEEKKERSQIEVHTKKWRREGKRTRRETPAKRRRQLTNFFLAFLSNADLSPSFSFRNVLFFTMLDFSVLFHLRCVVSLAFLSLPYESIHPSFVFRLEYCRNFSNLEISKKKKTRYIVLQKRKEKEEFWSKWQKIVTIT